MVSTDTTNQHWFTLMNERGEMGRTLCVYTYTDIYVVGAYITYNSCCYLFISASLPALFDVPGF